MGWKCGDGDGDGDGGREREIERGIERIGKRCVGP